VLWSNAWRGSVLHSAEIMERHVYCWLFSYFTCSQEANDRWGSSFLSWLFCRRNKPPRVLYMQLALELQGDADWPPRPSTVTYASDLQSHLDAPLWHQRDQQATAQTKPQTLAWVELRWCDRWSDDVRGTLNRRANPGASWRWGVLLQRMADWAARTESYLLFRLTSSG